MARLISRHHLTIDDKGRLVLPAVHRARYEDGAVLSPKTNHIGIYEPDEWESFVSLLREARNELRLPRESFNYITMSSADPKPDSAGRILIPTWMREQIGLGNDVMVGGNHEYLGIYRGDYFETLDPSIPAAAAAQVEALGL